MLNLPYRLSPCCKYIICATNRCQNFKITYKYLHLNVLNISTSRKICFQYDFSKKDKYFSITIKYLIVSEQLLRSDIKRYCTDRKQNDAKATNANSSQKRPRIIKAKEKFEQTKKKVLQTREKVKEIRENVLTVPNILCLTRIALSPILGYFVLQESYSIALMLFGLAGATDLFDGLIARNFKNQQSVFGSFLDPVADKFLVTTLFVTLTFMNLIPVPLTSLIIARDICLLSGGFYIRYQSLPPPKTFNRYFDITYATANLYPTFISKANTAIQLSLVAFTLAAPVFNYVNHHYLVTLWYITAGTTVMSGLSYIFSKDYVKFLQQHKK